MASEREGTALLLTPGADFDQIDEELENTTKRDLIFLARYLLPYKGLFMQLLLCMALGSLLQMAFPFLTQAMVDVGIGDHNLGFITIVLIAQLALFSRSWPLVFYGVG